MASAQNDPQTQVQKDAAKAPDLGEMQNYKADLQKQVQYNEAMIVHTNQHLARPRILWATDPLIPKTESYLQCVTSLRNLLRQNVQAVDAHLQEYHQKAQSVDSKEYLQFVSEQMDVFVELKKGLNEQVAEVMKALVEDIDLLGESSRGEIREFMENNPEFARGLD